MAQGLRAHRLVQEEWVPSLIQEELTGLEAKPGYHSCRAHALELVFCERRSHCNEQPVDHSQQSTAPPPPQLERSPRRSEDPAQPKANKENCEFKSATIKKKKEVVR